MVLALAVIRMIRSAAIAKGLIAIPIEIGRAFPTASRIMLPTAATGCEFGRHNIELPQEKPVKDSGEGAVVSGKTASFSVEISSVSLEAWGVEHRLLRLPLATEDCYTERIREARSATNS